MKAMGIARSRSWKLAAGLAFLCSSYGSIATARAQAPYLLPYTISTVAGGGTAPAVGANCPGSNGTTTKAEDALGNGCLASSSSVVTNTNIHDVGVDPVGNIYFLDTGSNTMLRRIDARSGIVNIAAGSNTASTVCTTTEIDAFGDGCPAADGKGNVAGGYTYLQSASRGITVGRNGDVYIADYSNSVVHKVSASTGMMTLVAGFVSGGTLTAPNKNKGAKGYTGDGGSATAAELNSDRGVAVDAAGNIYIADSSNNVVRMVTASTGNISTVVGKYPGSNINAAAGFSGDGGPATAALLSGPEDLEIDSNGNLFVADFGNSRIRVVYNGGAAVAKLISLTNGGTVAQAGNIYTIVGGGTGTFTAGSIVLATSIPVGSPRKMALDSNGNIYLADNSNNVIWFVDITTGYMRAIAGTYGATSGSTCTTTDAVGDNCQATLATLNPNSAMGVGVDAQGNVFISDSGNARVRKVALNTTFPAVAFGNAATQTLLVHFAAADTPAATSPFSIAGNADFTITGTPACTTNSATDNTTDCALSVAFTPSRPGPDLATLVINSTSGLTTKLALSGTGAVSSVALDPGVSAVAGSGFSSAAGIAQDAAGNIYVADTGHNQVVEFPVGGSSTVIAGTGASGFSGNGGAATAAKLAAPKAVAVTADGAVYIADTGNNVIRRVDPVTKFISTFGGGGTACILANDTLGDGCIATAAAFSAPAGLVADPTGNLYVSDTGNNVIREISTNGYVYSVAGGASIACTTGSDIYGNGCSPTQAIFKSPTALLIDPNHNLYVADTGNNEVRKITASTANFVSVVAGTGQPGGSGNGGLATTAQVNGPTGLALDAAGNIYVADTGNHVVRVVNASGNINSVVGTLGSNGTGTVPGSASAVLLNAPAAVSASGVGKLSVLDSGNNRLLSLDRGGVSLNFGRTNVGASSPSTTIQETATGTSTASLGYPLFATTGSTAVFTLAAFGSNGCSSSSSTPLTLAPGVSCALSAQFSPVALGPMTATYTESNATTINSPAPAIALTGTGAVLTKTTLTTAVTTPASGNPQYSIAFVVTATLHTAQCDPTAPNCSAAGTVTFMVDNTQVGLPIAVNNTSTTATNVITAAQTINGLSVGNHTVVAIYSGDTYYASSTASTLAVTVAQGSTTTVVTPTPASLNQFAALTLTAKVTSATSNIPTGSVSFYYGGNILLGTSGVNPTTGIATLNDTNPASTLGLPSGSYSITGVYSGDSNYATSTSAAAPLVVNPDPQGFTISLSSTSVGTAQGSTGTTLVYVTPTNTLNGTLTFSCTNLPANSDCTFGATPSATQTAGSNLTFTPVPGAATQQSLTVTLWTNINASVIPPNGALRFPKLFHHSAGPAFAAILGWPMLLGGFTAVIGFRKRLRNSRLLMILTLLALSGSAMVMTGCGNGSVTAGGSTPVGTYTVTLTVTGPNGLVQSTPITFIVGPGIAGQS